MSPQIVAFFISLSDLRIFLRCMWNHFLGVLTVNVIFCNPGKNCILRLCLEQLRPATNRVLTTNPISQRWVLCFPLQDDTIFQYLFARKYIPRLCLDQYKVELLHILFLGHVSGMFYVDRVPGRHSRPWKSTWLDHKYVQELGFLTEYTSIMQETGIVV